MVELYLEAVTVGGGVGRYGREAGVALGADGGVVDGLAVYDHVALAVLLRRGVREHVFPVVLVYADVYLYYLVRVEEPALVLHRDAAVPGQGREPAGE